MYDLYIIHIHIYICVSVRWCVLMCLFVILFYGVSSHHVIYLTLLCHVYYISLYVILGHSHRTCIYIYRERENYMYIIAIVYIYIHMPYTSYICFIPAGPNKVAPEAEAECQDSPARIHFEGSLL